VKNDDVRQYDDVQDEVDNEVSPTGYTEHAVKSVKSQATAAVGDRLQQLSTRE